MASGQAVRDFIDRVEQDGGVSLSPAERLLLATDGTVTHMLEALTRGPVVVSIRDRQVSGSELTRRVVLERESDGSSLVWAVSRVDLDPLAPDMKSELVRGEIGIGDLLRREYAETRREILGMSVTEPGDGGFPSFIDPGAGIYLDREYEIYSGGERVMLIRELFPKGLY